MKIPNAPVLTCQAASLAWNAMSHLSAARRRSESPPPLPGGDDADDVGATYSASSAGSSSLGIGDAIETIQSARLFCLRRTGDAREKNNDRMPLSKIHSFVFFVPTCFRWRPPLLLLLLQTERLAAAAAGVQLSGVLS